MKKPTNNYKQLLAEISFEALFLSQKGICIAQNETARKMFGYSDEEAIGVPGTNWIHPMDREFVATKMKENHSDPYEVIAQRKDGSHFPCEIQAKIIDYNGEKIRVTALRDISPRKTIEKELFDKVTELEIITASIPNSIWKAKLGENGEISEAYISDSINGLLDLEPGTIKNDWNQYFAYVLPEEIPMIKNKIMQAIKNPGRIVTHIYKVKKGDGKVAWLSSSGRVQMTKSGAIGYGFSYDVSELKENEQALIELNATKDKLFSIISHDLKNPFTAFMGFSELMIRQIDDGKYDNIRKYAEAILVGARNGSDLLSNLLDWSRTQRNKVTFNPELIQVDKVIENVVMYFEQTLNSKELSLEVKNENADSFIGDRMMVETILRNLISNAIKFSKRNDQIKISLSADHQNTSFTVEDNGLGISSENQKKLFNINSNYTTQGTENEKGTGLGLALCKEFVDFHGGKIGLESKPLEGSKFWFTIPKK